MEEQPSVCCKRKDESDEMPLKLSSKNIVVKNDSDSIVKCQQLLNEKCSVSDCDLEYSDSDSIISETISQSQSACNCEYCENLAINILLPEGNEITEHIGFSLLEGKSNEYGNVKIVNSKHVVIGNVTYVTGPVYITQTTSSVHQHTTVNQINDNQANERLQIVSRINWLARPPFTKTIRPKPVQFVIIGHTQTEEAFTQIENTKILRFIQAYHMRCRKWDDIAYNFLIGSDGKVYEGRGWALQGSHTLGCNHKSVCLVFIGDFVEHLPPPVALNAAKALIQLGVELGHIPADYILVGHSQLRPFDSPGRLIFEEIKTWPRWQELIVQNNEPQKLTSFFEFVNSEKNNLEV